MLIAVNSRTPTSCDSVDQKQVKDQVYLQCQTSVASSSCVLKINIESANNHFKMLKEMLPFKNYFNWRLITLQYFGRFCHTLTWTSHACTCVPDPETSSHLPYHPSGCPSALALSDLFHASNLDWWSISHMVKNMFQCYSLKSSHPHLLLESKSLFFTSVSLLLFCI